MSLLIDGSVHMITASLGSPALVEELQRIGRRTASESVGRSVGRSVELAPGRGRGVRAGAAPASLRPAQWRGRTTRSMADGVQAVPRRMRRRRRRGGDDTAYAEGKRDGTTLSHYDDDDAGAKVTMVTMRDSLL